MRYIFFVIVNFWKRLLSGKNKRKEGWIFFYDKKCKIFSVIVGNDFINCGGVIDWFNFVWCWIE